MNPRLLNIYAWLKQFIQSECILKPQIYRGITPTALRYYIPTNFLCGQSYGMVWYGMVWYGMVWYGMVWYGMVWYGMVWYGMVWYGMVWYGMVLLCFAPKMLDVSWEFHVMSCGALV